MHLDPTLCRSEVSGCVLTNGDRERVDRDKKLLCEVLPSMLAHASNPAKVAHVVHEFIGSAMSAQESPIQKDDVVPLVVQFLTGQRLRIFYTKAEKHLAQTGFALSRRDVGEKRKMFHQPALFTL